MGKRCFQRASESCRLVRGSAWEMDRLAPEPPAKRGNPLSRPGRDSPSVTKGACSPETADGKRGRAAPTRMVPRKHRLSFLAEVRNESFFVYPAKEKGCCYETR